jgi:hypothetical protein
LLHVIEARAARLRQRGGALGATCLALESGRDRVKRAEHGSFALLRSSLRLLIRFIFEFLILIVVVLFELDTVRRRAAHALVSPPR